jgi:hypothetical protein
MSDRAALAARGQTNRVGEEDGRHSRVARQVHCASTRPRPTLSFFLLSFHTHAHTHTVINPSPTRLQAFRCCQELEVIKVSIDRVRSGSRRAKGIACGMLACVAQDAAIRAQALDMGAIEPVVQILRYGTDIGRHNAVAAIAVLACSPDSIESALEWGAIPLISAMLLANAGGDSGADDFEKELQVRTYGHCFSPNTCQLLIELQLAEATARVHALRVQTHHAPVGMEHKLSIKKPPSHDERECVTPVLMNTRCSRMPFS